MVLRKTLESPLNSMEIKPVNLEINPEYSLEKNLMLEKLKCRRRRGQQRMRWLDGITNAMDMNLGKVWEMLGDTESWRATVHVVMKSQK